jgi:hypothetical protein
VHQRIHAGDGLIAGQMTTQVVGGARDGGDWQAGNPGDLVVTQRFVTGD